MALKTVLITGCSDDGIGSALAIVFQQRGFHVFATARDPSKMSKLKDLPNVTFLTLDVVNHDHIKAAAKAVAEETGGSLDLLISNAGRNHFMPILDEDVETVRRLFDINLVGPLVLTQAFAPLLIKAKGQIVFVTSISGHLNIPYMGTYSATKIGLEVIADTLRLELTPFGVDVLSVVTGGVKTRGQTYFGDFALPADSYYKKIEDTIASRARGEEGMPRTDLMEYATEVADEILKRTTGKLWSGFGGQRVKDSTTSAVPQSAMDAGAVIGTALDVLAAEQPK